MREIFFVGVLTVNNGDDDVIRELVRNILHSRNDLVEDREIVFDHDCVDPDDMQKFVEELDGIGLSVTGTINYYGDKEGSLEIRNNQIIELTKEKKIVRDAPDELLINELKRRGYSVPKKNQKPDKSQEIGTDGIKILGYYYRRRDQESFILYEDNGRQYLTNGVFSWKSGLKRRLAELENNQELCDINKITKNLCSCMPYSPLTAYLRA